MKLQDIDLERLLPAFMRRDEGNLALASAASDALRLLAREISKLSTWDALGMLATEELDALAEELHVLWYDKAFSDDQKRALLLASDQVYRRLGTVKAVRDVVTSVFGEATIEEFYQYGGRPHYFRINVANAATLSAENEAKLLRMLEHVKRKSQWLDSIYADTIAALPLNIGLGVSFQTVIYPDIATWQDNTFAATLGIGQDLSTHTNEQSTITK